MSDPGSRDGLSDGSSRRQRRAERTRRAVLAAARSLFVEKGYTATTVTDVAEEADVALQTVYSSVGSKAYLLVALLDQAREDAQVFGIDANSRAWDGPWAVLESGPRVRRALMEEAGDIVKLLHDNAASDPDIKRAWDELLSRAQGGAELAMQLLAGFGALRPGIDPVRAADQAGAIMHPGVTLFLLDRGWDLAQIEAWMLDALVRTVTTLEPPG